MAREQGDGGRRSPKGKSGASKGKSGWVKPDGTPLRKRKGDYFPDQEINKRKPAQRSKSTYPRTSSDAPRPEKKDFRERSERDETRTGFKSKSDNSERSERNESRPPYKTASDRPDRPYNKDRGNSRSNFKNDDRPDRDSKPASRSEYKPDSERSERPERSARPDKGERTGRPGRAGRDAARSQYRGRPDIAPREEKSSRTPRSGDNEKQNSERPSRDSQSDKPLRKGSYAEYKSRSSRDDRKEDSDRNANSDRPKRDDKRSPFPKKPFEKKRERYADRDHSKEMRGRFDTKSGDKAPKRRESYKKKIADGESEAIAPGAVRLNKFIANAGICSRREADDLITAGVISVNGNVVTELGTKVNAGDEVKFNDQTLRTETMVYVLLNKPKDYITTTDDPEERKTVMNLVHDAGKERIFPVGRLDRNTTGLLLLTNDGELTKRLTHPSGNVKKIYQVELDSNLTQDDMIRAAEGVELEDGIASVDEIHYESPTEKNIVGVELHSGRNRVVRRIFEAMDYKVRKLDRVYFAGLTKKDLPRGRWRYLTDMEVNMLKMLTGKKK